MTPKQNDLIQRIHRAEAHSNLPLRNQLAQAFFRNRANRLVVVNEKLSVETVWDTQTRNYYTLTLDENGNQVGDADYTGHKNDAAVAHAWAIQRALHGAVGNGC